MHGASAQLIESSTGQKTYLIIVLAVFGLLMVLSMSVFAFMSFRLQQRVTQADAMLLAVGKRVIAMDESLELFKGHGEALREVASKQDAVTSQLTKIELRLDDVVRTVQLATDAVSKPAAGADKPGHRDHQSVDPTASGAGTSASACGPGGSAQRSRSLGASAQSGRGQCQAATGCSARAGRIGCTGQTCGKAGSVSPRSGARQNGIRGPAPRHPPSPGA
ncbi:MAG: hypothetical protein EBT37_09190 [Betaproteobacteria bacterium]|nr:hypothetical protein [Betaproteobacteria bacterium]